VVVKTVERLKEIVDRGGRIYPYPGGRWRIYDPLTKRFEMVDRFLNEFAKQIYEGQSEGKYAVEDFESDVKFLLSTIKQRIDPKAPIITKWTENISWWTHIFLDFSALVSPYILSLLTPNEIDLSNPEVTVKNMVGKFEALREKPARVSEIEAKLKSENEALKQTLSKYEKLIDDQNKLLAEVLDKAKRTVNFFLIVLPKRLPEEVRETYKIYASKIREIWLDGKIDALIREHEKALSRM
jgi:hypothetical protein